MRLRSVAFGHRATYAQVFESRNGNSRAYGASQESVLRQAIVTHPMPIRDLGMENERCRCSSGHLRGYFALLL